MRKFHLFILTVSVLIIPGLSAGQTSTNALTLIDCYQLALKQSETVAISAEEIKAAEGRFIQSLSGVLPKAYYVYSDRRQDGSNSSNFTLDRVPEQRFTVSQPLFSGFKEFAAMGSSKAETRQRKFERSRAEQLLFLDVVNAFYLYLSYQEEYKTLESIQQALLERVDDLKKREELGRSRPSETASVESRLGRLEADLEFIRGEGEEARQLLEFLTGTAIDVVVDDPSMPEFTLVKDIISEEAESRPDVQAAKQAWIRARRDVIVAQSGFWPSVTLEGNYYRERVGNSRDVDWDATLTVEVPLFEGGVNIGLLKEAKAVRTQQELTYQQTKRTAELEIRNALTSWESSQRRLEAVKKAMAATDRNYELQKEDYRLNLVNNLDVLQALEDAENMRRDFINIRSQTKRDYWGLKTALGEISKEDL